LYHFAFWFLDQKCVFAIKGNTLQEHGVSLMTLKLAHMTFVTEITSGCAPERETISQETNQKNLHFLFSPWFVVNINQFN
jgi:hypothetical protein